MERILDPELERLLIEEEIIEHRANHDVTRNRRCRLCREVRLRVRSLKIRLAYDRGHITFDELTSRLVLLSLELDHEGD